MSVRANILAVRSVLRADQKLLWFVGKAGEISSALQLVHYRTIFSDIKKIFSVFAEYMQKS
jgi:hypothetical protein